MKKIIIATIVLLTVFSGYAQDPLWRKSTMTAGNVTFNVRTSPTITGKNGSGYVFAVSNTTNTRHENVLYYTNGEEVTDMAIYNGVQAKSVSGTVEQAIAATFTDAQIANLAKSKDPMGITYVVSPEGKTLEVEFVMNNSPEMLSITPAQFAALDSNLKKYVTWTVNDYVKQVQYTYSCQFVWFDKLNIVRPAPPATGSGSSDSSTGSSSDSSSSGISNGSTHPSINKPGDDHSVAVPVQ